MLSRFSRLLLQKPAHQIINMPALSPTMQQGNITEWKKNIGDELQPGDILAEIETDKASMDFEFQEEGFLAKIFVSGGTKDIKVGTPIAVFVEDAKDVAQFEDFTPPTSASKPTKSTVVEEKVEKKSQEIPITTTQSSVSATSSNVKASPLVKKLSQLEKVDIKSMKGSGPNSRIVLSDYIKQKNVTNATSPAGPAYKDEEVSQMRKSIAERLTFSKSTIPHYYLSSKMNVDKLTALRQTLKEQNLVLSINDFVMKAVALTLRDHPEVNSAWLGDSIRRFSSVDLCMAVATDKGLITPIIKNADKLGLSELNSTTKALAEKARNNKLKPEEYQGGSFTVSYLGMYGIDSFSAIINPPQSGILAVSAIKNEVKLVNQDGKDLVLPTRILTMTGSFDHRIVDGAVGANFLKTLKSYIENPLMMLK